MLTINNINIKFNQFQDIFNRNIMIVSVVFLTKQNYNINSR